MQKTLVLPLENMSKIQYYLESYLDHFQRYFVTSITHKSAVLIKMTTLLSYKIDWDKILCVNKNVQNNPLRLNSQTQNTLPVL